MPDAPRRFDLPIRTSEIWAPDDDGRPRPFEDIAADLDYQDQALEDWANETVPNTYIQLSAFGGTTIDPAMLAVGTPTNGYAPVWGTTVATWTDIATQAELNALYGVTPRLGTELQRGTVAWTLGVADTNTLTTVIFGSVFSVAPVVVLTVRNTAGLNLGCELTAVTSAQFTTRVFPTAGIAVGTASGDVHWHAVKA